MSSLDNALRHELIAAGADETEARELASIAARLQTLKAPEQATPNIARYARPKRLACFGLATAAFAVSLAVIASWSVLPGSRLYPIQKFSDSVAIAARPSYRATVMMRRAAQVKALVNEQAPSAAVLAALADYQQQAAASKSTPANYAVFERCKTSLQQAANAAPNPQRAAIAHTLESLRDV
jgi:hypothetical protein